MLYARVAEVPERVRADGTIEKPLDLEAARAALKAGRADGITSVAIVFMHSYAYPAHEQQAMRLARDFGFSDQSAFTQQFHKHLGLTPLRYQRQFRLRRG